MPENNVTLHYMSDNNSNNNVYMKYLNTNDFINHSYKITFNFTDGSSYTVDNAASFESIYKSVQTLYEKESKIIQLQEALARVSDLFLKECPKYTEWFNIHYKGLL